MRALGFFHRIIYAHVLNAAEWQISLASFAEERVIDAGLVVPERFGIIFLVCNAVTCNT